MGPDGYAHKTEYVADITGFHPRISKTPLTTSQENAVAEYTEGVYIVPKVTVNILQNQKQISGWWPPSSVISAVTHFYLGISKFMDRLCISSSLSLQPDEERRETEKRILAWLEDNRNRIEEPLR